MRSDLRPRAYASNSGTLTKKWRSSRISSGRLQSLGHGPDRLPDAPVARRGHDEPSRTQSLDVGPQLRGQTAAVAECVEPRMVKWATGRLQRQREMPHRRQEHHDAGSARPHASTLRPPRPSRPRRPGDRSRRRPRPRGRAGRPAPAPLNAAQPRIVFTRRQALRRYFTSVQFLAQRRRHRCARRVDSLLRAARSGGRRARAIPRPARPAASCIGQPGLPSRSSGRRFRERIDLAREHARDISGCVRL